MFIAILKGFCLSPNNFLIRSLGSDLNKDILSDSGILYNMQSGMRPCQCLPISLQFGRCCSLWSWAGLGETVLPRRCLRQNGYVHSLEAANHTTLLLYSFDFEFSNVGGKSPLWTYTYHSTNGFTQVSLRSRKETIRRVRGYIRTTERWKLWTLTKVWSPHSALLTSRFTPQLTCLSRTYLTSLYEVQADYATEPSPIGNLANVP